MYSSSPNILKHYVPLNFSKQSLDYTYSPKKKVSPPDQNPFRNIKLRDMQSKPKDFVLIFKNKSSRSFCAKKKIQFIPLLKNMKLAHKNCMIIKQKQKKIYNILIQKDPYHSLRIKSKPSTSGKTRRSSNTPSGLSDRKLTTGYKSFRGAIYQDTNVNPSPQMHHYQNNSKTKQIDLRIMGNKAPSSEIVDHWKKNSVDGFYQFVDKIIK